LSSAPRIRPAAPDDEAAVARLVYETSPGMYDIYAGGAERAMRILRASYRRAGTNASRDATWIAELDGAVAGAMTVFPASEAELRSRRSLRATLARTPPWRWPRTVSVFRAGADAAPVPPPDSLYVVSLAADTRFRRRGVATALLDEASRLAAEQGLRAVSLDTAAANEGAQALYEAAGFSVTEHRPPMGVIPGTVGYVRPLGRFGGNPGSDT
jgi:GNAT superfamily N-acetyltransferase